MKKWIEIRKKLAACVLFMSMMGPFLSHFHFAISRSMHRHEMWEMAESENFETLTLKKNELVWIKKHKEILINGTYFDVKKIAYKEDMVIVTGIYDNEEKALEEKFEREQESNNNDARALAKLISWWQLVCIQSLPDEPINDSYFLTVQYPIQPSPKPFGQRGRPISPPPNIA
jgi:hypothetical protein